MQLKNWFDWVTFIILFIGGLNWGLVGLAGFNLVSAIFGSGTMIASYVYMAVGVCAIYLLVRALKGSK